VNREGVELFSTLKFGFEPISEQFFVNRVLVFDEHGHQVGSVDVDDCYVLTAPDGSMVTGERTLHVPVPGLRPGSRLEYQVTWKNRSVPKGFPFRQFDTELALPGSRMIVQVSGDVSGIQWTGPAPVPTDGGLLWDVVPVRMPNESVRDDLVTSPSVISVCDRGTSWTDSGREYLKDIDSRMAISPQVRELSASLLAGMESARTEEKVTKLADWVQHHITYQGIEFGWRGQIMPPVEQTVKNRYGDCKDHSMLLCQLARAAGITAHPVLISTQKPTETALPSMTQFNHMIAYVEDDLGPRYVDCTDKYVSQSMRVPLGLAQRVALVLDPSQPKLVRLPDYPADGSRVVVDRNVLMDAEGGAVISESLTFTGYRASGIRQVMSGLDHRERRSVVRQIVLPDGLQCSLRDFEIKGIEDLHQPVTIRIEYEAAGLLHPIRKELVGRLPVFSETGPWNLHESPDRSSTFRLQYPLEMASRTRIRLPDGFTVQDLPESVSESAPLVDRMRKVTASDGIIEVQVHLRRRNGTAALADFDRVIALEPRHADALFNRGNALKDLGRPEEAVESYTRAIASAPARADFIMMRVRTLMTLNRRAEALEGLAAVAKLKPDNVDIPIMQGNLLMELGRANEALAAARAPARGRNWPAPPPAVSGRAGHCRGC